MVANDGELFDMLRDWLAHRPPVVKVGGMYFDKPFIVECVDALQQRQLDGIIDPSEHLNALEKLAVAAICEAANIKLPG